MGCESQMERLSLRGVLLLSSGAYFYIRSAHHHRLSISLSTQLNSTHFQLSASQSNCDSLIQSLKKSKIIPGRKYSMNVVKAEEESAVGIKSTTRYKEREAEVGYAKRALVGAGARMLFYPTLLYNVIRNKVEPRQFRWWDQIDQYILLEAVPFPKDVLKLKKLGVSGVITLNEPFETLVPTTMYQKHEMEHLVIPTRDYLFSPSIVDISRAVEFIHKNASAKQTTYVHCKAGRGRSTTVVLCYLIEHKQMTPIAALEYVRSIRPRVALTPAQWKAVQEYKRPQSSLSDTVIITKADLEGYDRNCEDNIGIQLTQISRTASATLMISNLLASLKVLCGAPPKKSDACTD